MLVYVFNLSWEAAFFWCMVLLAFIVWEAYKEDHDNWFTRLVEWLDDHYTTIILVAAGIIVVLYVLLVFLMRHTGV